MQIKTTVTYPLTSLRWLLSKRLEIISVREEVDKENPCVLLTGMQMNAGTMENSMEGPQKVKNRTTIQSIQTPLLHVYLKKMKTLIRKDRCTSCVHCSITYSSKDRETT